MNDRFKFRAYDEFNKIMHYDFQFIKSGDKGNDWMIFQSDKQKLDFDKEKAFCINIYPNPCFAQQLKIMQYTGLKDKNGKLIYEGDVVKQNKTMYYVTWEKGSYGFCDIRTKITYTVEFIMNKRQEVIGNIYENPELLKECE